MANVTVPGLGDRDTSRLNSSVRQIAERLNDYAPLDSPAFTNNPTAPTPATGDADTSIATTGFVDRDFFKKTGGTVIGDIGLQGTAGGAWGSILFRRGDGTPKIFITPGDPAGVIKELAINQHDASGAFVRTPLYIADNGDVSLLSLPVISGKRIDRGAIGDLWLRSIPGADWGNVIYQRPDGTPLWAWWRNDSPTSDFVVVQWDTAGAYVRTPMAISYSSGTAYFHTVPYAGIDRIATEPWVYSVLPPPTWTIVKKPSDQGVTNNASFVNDNDLQFTMQPNTTYAIRGVMLYTIGAGGAKYAVSGPSGPAKIRFGVGTALDGGLAAVSAYDSLIGAVGSGSGQSCLSSFSGLLRTGGSGGTFVMRIAQNASNAATTTFEAGSYLEYAVVS